MEQEKNSDLSSLKNGRFALGIGLWPLAIAALSSCVAWFATLTGDQRQNLQVESSIIVLLSLSVVGGILYAVYGVRKYRLKRLKTMVSVPLIFVFLSFMYWIGCFVAGCCCDVLKHGLGPMN